MNINMYMNTDGLHYFYLTLEMRKLGAVKTQDHLISLDASLSVLSPTGTVLINTACGYLC